jgi:hypothetical protein
MAELSEQAHATILRIKIIQENMEKRLNATEEDIPEKRMQDIEAYLKFSADWLYQAYREI